MQSQLDMNGTGDILSYIYSKALHIYVRIVQQCFREKWSSKYIEIIYD